jgi:hypothetical protein
LGKAVNFEEKGLAGIYAQNQIVSNQYPCSFYGTTRKLGAGESLVMYQLIGQVAKKDILKKFMKKELNAVINLGAVIGLILGLINIIPF